MNDFRLLTLTFATAALAACGPLSASLESTVTCEDRLCSMSIPLQLDQSDVLQSASFQNDGLRAQGLLGDVLSVTPTLTLVSTLASPLVNGVSVQASDVTMNGTKVYVAYNTAGETQSGAIDVLEAINPNAVTMLSQALYPTMDIHKVLVNNGKLYAAGADGNGALLRRVTLDLSGKLTATSETKALRSAADPLVPAYAGTSVAVSGSNVYALSGSNGGMSILSTTDLSFSSFTAIPDARDISIAGSSALVVTGRTNTDQAQIKNYNLSGVAQSSGNVTLPNAVALDEGKSTIQAGTFAHIASAGYGGARIICAADGTTMGYAPIPTVSGLTSAKQMANAVAFGGGYMFVANGEAGVSFYSVNVPLVTLTCSQVTITYIGRLSLGTTASVNNIYYSSGYLVVATGSKGFSIVKVTTPVLAGLLQVL